MWKTGTKVQRLERMTDALGVLQESLFAGRVMAKRLVAETDPKMWFRIEVLIY